MSFFSNAAMIDNPAMAWTSLILGQGTPLLKDFLRLTFALVVLVVLRRQFRFFIDVLALKIYRAKGFKTPWIEFAGEPESVKEGLTVLQPETKC